jgi:hypothetical protein
MDSGALSRSLSGRHADDEKERNRTYIELLLLCQDGKGQFPRKSRPALDAGLGFHPAVINRWTGKIAEPRVKHGVTTGGEKRGEFPGVKPIEKL